MISIIVGMKWGDEAKGKAVAYYTHTNSAQLNVRFNGGGHGGAAVYHNNLHHQFNLFGAGTFFGAKTHISHYVRFNPFGFTEELSRLAKVFSTEQDLLKRITIDKRCLVTTPYHEEQSKWLAGQHKRGSIGVGAGETWRHAQAFPDEAIYVQDLLNAHILRDKIDVMEKRYAEVVEQSWLKDDAESITEYLTWVGSLIQTTGEEEFQDMLNRYPDIVFEGTQGVLIDQTRGDIPYVTSSNTTFEQALALLKGYTGQIERIGCMRLYETRHGPGPFPTEAPELAQYLPEFDNQTGPYNGAIRTGWFDAAASRRGLEITQGVDKLILSHVDYWDRLPEWKIGDCVGGEVVYTTFSRNNLEDYLQHIEQSIGSPIDLLSNGPSVNQVILRLRSKE